MVTLKHSAIGLGLLFLIPNTELLAQTGADYLKAYKTTTCTIPFDINAEGTPFRVNWGMDTAWDWDANVNRGIAHIGKENFSTGRVSFQPNDLVTTNADGSYSLTSAQQTALLSRINHIKLTGVTEANINCDHEALNDRNGFANYVGKPEEWYKLIKASVQYCENHGLHIISISPFNEPDYTGWGEGSKDDFLNICKLLKNDSYFNDVRICGGNTLNCDEALNWYNYLKDYLDEGNTHQLAGSLSNYSKFFSTVVSDGKKATGDELHNVGEAIVGVNYGMTTGIWWGFDSRARGQFCKDSNHGVRLGYAEDGTSWTSGAVYRNDDDNEIHAYIGSSERQATDASYRFVSTKEDVYFNGYGPCREYVVDIPGGTGYQKGQINAEKLIDVTYGDDVPQEYINGTYVIMSYYNQKPLALPSTGSASGETVKTINRVSSNATQQQWVVTPQNIDGDCSYWTICLNTGKNMYMDLLNWNLNAGASVIAYANTSPGGNEQWYFKYAGSGFWYIINRYSNKALRATSVSSGTAVTVGECPTASTSFSTKKQYMWRFQKLNAPCNVTQPKWADTKVSTVSYPASIALNWTAIEDTTVTYNVLRAKTSDMKFNTIARSISGSKFLDNTAISDTVYSYKVVPVAYNGTRGASSDTVTAVTEQRNTMIAQYQFDKDLTDRTVNQMTAALYGTDKYATLIKKSGTAAISLTSQDSYLEVPYSLVNRDAMTISCWVRWNSSNSWERIFDFGNGTDQYMFLTPSNGTEMRFVMKNGGDEEILSAGSKLKSTTWKHIALTFSPQTASGSHQEEVKLYVDGALVATKTFSIAPSDIAPVLNYIGRSQFSADPLLKAYLDDFRVYNYPLTAEEVAALMDDTGEVATAVEGISNGVSNSQPVATYTTSGIRTATPARGISIIKTSDGRTVKVKK